MRIGRRRAGGTTKKSNNWRNSRELERMKIVCRMAGGRTNQTTTSYKIKFWCQLTWSRTRLGGYDEICLFWWDLAGPSLWRPDGQAALFSQISHCFHVVFWRLTAWLDQLMDINLEVKCCESPVQLLLKDVLSAWIVIVSPLLRVNLWDSADHQMWQAVLHGHRPMLQLQSMEAAASNRSPPKARRPTSCYQHTLCTTFWYFPFVPKYPQHFF